MKIQVGLEFETPAEAIGVLTALEALREQLERARQAGGMSPDAAPESEPGVVVTEETLPTASMEDVDRAAQKLAQAKGVPAVRDLLEGRFGVRRLRDLTTAQYGEFVTAARVARGE